MSDLRVLALAGLAVAAGGVALLAAVWRPLAHLPVRRAFARAVARTGGAGLAVGLLAAWPALDWPGAATALHAAAALVWVGALAWLAWLLGRLDGEERAAAAVRRRAAALGALSLALLAAAGVAVAVRTVGEPASLVATTYGRLVAAKGIGAVVLAALGLASLRRGSGRFAQASAALQAVLGVGLLVLAGRLALEPEAVAVDPVWPLGVRPTTAALPPGMGRTAALGVALAAGGLVALAASTVVVGSKQTARIFGGFALAGGMILLAPARDYLLIDAYPTTFVKPPTPYTASSVASGLALYAEHCRVCHGPDGRGNPAAAATLGVTPADLASIHTRLHTPGDHFWWITNGVRPTDGAGLAVCETPGTPVPDAPPVIRSELSMPAFGTRLPEAARWDLVHAVRFLGDVVAAERLGPVPAAEATVRAPALGLPEGRAALVAILPDGSGDARRAALERLAPTLSEAGVDVVLPQDPETADLYARLGGGGEGPVEFLVDAQGFVRARWRPGETPSWDDPERLVAFARATRGQAFPFSMGSGLSIFPAGSGRTGGS